MMILSFLILLAAAYWPRHHTMEREPGVPYMTRWVLTGRDGRRSSRWPLCLLSNRFIHWLRASDNSEFHSHPYELARSRVLWGLFTETRLMPPVRQGISVLGNHQFIRRRGTRYTIDAEVWHRLDLVRGPVITYFTTGKKHGRGWGFTDGRGKFRPAPR